jgi:hypothetical protein
MSDYTETELSALRRAYASGRLRLDYEGKSVTYGSAEDLLSRIREIERSVPSAAPRRSVGFAGFSRGLRG